MTEVTIRKVTKNDIPEIIKQRRLMFESMGFNNFRILQLTSDQSRKYFLEHMQNNKFYGWVAITKKGRIISNAAVIIDHHPPGPNNLTGKIAYIFNLYTYPEFRQQGIAMKLMKTILKWAKEKNIPLVTLHATDYGEKLYKSLGFTDSREMRLSIEE